MAIADRGYATSGPVLMRKLATPNPADSDELRRCKSRARARHETLNERIKNFKILLETYRHNVEKHKAAFEAVCVMVQYQLNNGAPLFDV
ncbi:hypothetical protein ACA910_008356 [Epithemia clementina (nom. ined.)]